jgi:DNA polymerase II small subunit
MFLEKNFLKFISWLNGELGDEKQKLEAKKVKYLFLTGDNIDGVGVYPSQENWLEIKDIKKQYERLAGYLSMLRKDITIVICPGQHDAVRVAEPQPAIEKEYGYALHELESVVLVSNPAFVEINNNHNGKRGFRILMYHGDSLIPVFSEVDSLRVSKARENPAKIVRYLLKIRHLSPIHSQSIYIPDAKSDELVIKEIPDIITTADLHKPEIDIYNNIFIICSSCWQSMTPYEEKVGNHPDPCKVPILNLKTRAIKIMDFSELEEKEKKCEEKDNQIKCEVK